MKNSSLTKQKVLNTTVVENYFSKKINLSSYEGYAMSISIAYILLRAQENPSITITTLEDFTKSANMNKELEAVLSRYAKNHWYIVVESMNIFSSELLKAYILCGDIEKNQRDICPTPYGIRALSYKVLDIQKEDDVLELCMGSGSFFVGNADNCMNYTGIELLYALKDIAFIRVCCLNKDYSLILHNALTYYSDKKFNKLFANYPFMLRNTSDESRDFIKGHLGFSSLGRASSDWLFNAALVMNMAQNGKAIGIMTVAAAYNLLDREVRKQFIENGYIETIIALPKKLFNNTAVSCVLVVMSFGNENVNFVDASNICSQGRRINEITDMQVEEIISLIGTESDRSTIKSFTELAQNDYSLDPSRYLFTPIVKDGVEFGSLIKNITRGIQLKSSDLDELISAVETPYQYVKLSNIVDGMFKQGEDMLYLKSIPKQAEKYCLKRNTILLSKMGTPIFKSAVVPVDENTVILPSINFFAIEVDENIVDPYYIQAFLASEKGIQSLQKVATGNITSSISLESLKKVIVPQVTKEREKEIANQYAACLDEVALLSLKRTKVLSRMNHLFDEEV